ncbi:MAG: exodeoxyribonuclease VII small subunit [Proteobacteria bacterium]|nr:exodeoxyribonuclease VII small subunit [Pseudomonadota bacterium]
MEEKSTYAQDIQRIQQIVELLGQKDCDIDNMLKLVNEATALIAKCQNKLISTGVQINEALAKLNAMKES